MAAHLGRYPPRRESPGVPATIGTVARSAADAARRLDGAPAAVLPGFRSTRGGPPGARGTRVPGRRGAVRAAARRACRGRASGVPGTRVELWRGTREPTARDCENVAALRVRVARAVLL